LQICDGVLILAAVKPDGDAHIGLIAVGALTETPIVSHSRLHGLMDGRANGTSPMTGRQRTQVLDEVIVGTMTETDRRSPIGFRMPPWSFSSV
jgi:hypothetical protein